MTDYRIMMAGVTCLRLHRILYYIQRAKICRPPSVDLSSPTLIIGEMAGSIRARETSHDAPVWSSAGSPPRQCRGSGQCQLLVQQLVERTYVYVFHRRREAGVCRWER